MKRFGRFVAGRAGFVLAVVAAITLFALHGIVDLRTGTPRLGVDPSIERLLPEGDEERAFFDRARQLFGADEFVVVLLEGPEDLFTPAGLERVQRMTRRLAAVDGVQRVLSLANAVQIEERDGDVFVGPFFETPPQDAAALARLRANVQAHPFYGETLVTRDGRGAAFLVSFERMPERELLGRRLSAQVEQAAEAERGAGRTWITGSPHLKLVISETLVGELGRILPTLLGLVVLLTAVTFRTLRGVALPVVTITLAVVWTLGAMGWTGSPLNLVSNLIPGLLITLGFAAAMHVVSEYYETLRRHPSHDAASHRERIAHVLDEMGVAIAVNGLTTVLGFASLCTSGVVAVRLFGAWAVVGIVATTVLAMTFLPAALSVAGTPRRVPGVGNGQGGAVDRFAERLARFDVRHRRPILGGAVLVLLLAVFFMTRIEVGTTYIGDFAETSPVRQGYEEITRRLGGTSAFTIVVEADEPGGMVAPENLRALRELQDWIEAQPEVATTASIADGVALLHHALRGPEATEAIPADASLVKQLLLFGGDDVTRGFLDRSQRSASVLVRSNVSDSRPVRAFLERLDARLAELPRRVQARATGDLVLLNRTVDAIAVGELQSLGTAFLTIFLTLSAMLTRHRRGRHGALPRALQPRGAPPRRRDRGDRRDAEVRDPSRHVDHARPRARLSLVPARRDEEPAAIRRARRLHDGGRVVPRADALARALLQPAPRHALGARLARSRRTPRAPDPAPRRSPAAPGAHLRLDGEHRRAARRPAALRRGRSRRRDVRRRGRRARRVPATRRPPHRALAHAPRRHRR
ncbi:MAG: MMPL family transporter, partial [Myxococcota bacterium]|nr:MMPL family transporter [Myxococcota bacterium]